MVVYQGRSRPARLIGMDHQVPLPNGGVGQPASAPTRPPSCCWPRWRTSTGTGKRSFRAPSNGVVGGLLARERADRPAIAPSPRARMRTATGRWLTLHATWLAGSREGRERQIAAVLEASPPTQVWPLVTAAHRLSSRGSTLLVVRGRSTSEIGQSLRISEHTVEDQLKAVFDKFGVRSRGQLTAAIFGSHYLPLMMSSSY